MGHTTPMVMGGVLIIDDNSHIRRVMRTIIEAEGHEVFEAESGQAGLDMLSHKPDAIFVDVDMPNMTGVQFLLQLRQHPQYSQTPATFVTAHGERISVFANTGIAEPWTVNKPFKRAELTHALSRMLTSTKRRNLKVSLLPSVMRVDADNEPAGVLLGLSKGEIGLQTIRPLKDGNKYRLRIDTLELDTMCTSIAPNLTKLRVSSQQPHVAPAVSRWFDQWIQTVEGKMSAVVAWTRSGDPTTGFLREINASGAYVVCHDAPKVKQQVVVQLPWKNQELRGCTATVTRIGGDGFACTFVDPSTEFCIALNALLSDGTVLAGEGRALSA